MTEAQQVKPYEWRYQGCIIEHGVREWDRSTFLRVLHEERRRMFESGEAPDWVE